MHKRISMRNKAAIITAAASVLAVGKFAKATDYVWNPAVTSGLWSDAGSWTANSGSPSSATDTASFTDVTVDETAIYTTTGNSAVGGITITQSSTQANTVHVMSTTSGGKLTLSNPLTLGAASGGTSTFILDEAASVAGGNINYTLVTPTLTLNSGGVLELISYTNASGNTQEAVTANVAINNGGTLFSDRSWSSNPTGDANTNSITGTLTMQTGGTFSIGLNQAAVGTNGQMHGGTSLSADDRFSISGNFTATGGTLSILSTNTLQLSGKNNSIQLTGNTAIAGNVSLFTQSTTGQTSTLSSDSAINGNLQLRQTNKVNGFATTIAMGAVTSGNTLSIGSITFQNTGTLGSETLQLTSDIKTSAVPNTSSNATGVTDVLDLNGHAFTVTDPSNLYTLSAATGGIWFLKNTNAPHASTITAVGYNLSGPGGGSNVGSNVVLTATKGGVANILSNANGGTVDANSTFNYAPTTLASTASTLSSSRAIGSVAINAGTLLLGTAVTVASTATTSVAAGSTLGLNTFVLTTGHLAVNGTVNGTGRIAASGIVSGTGTVGASLGMTSSGTLAPGGLNNVGTLNLGSGSGALTLAGSDKASFDIASDSSYDTINATGVSIAYSGTLNLNFTYNPDMSGVATPYTLFTGATSPTGTFTGGITSNLGSGYTLSFDAPSGTLTVTPEPGSLALLGASGLLTLRRRRRAKA